MDINCDIFIIGGGINGCAIAADAALRGYSVTLIDKADFAGGTSWTSTKLIHGGLRYLAQGHIGLVRKALQERTRLHENAPLHVQPIALNLLGQDHWFKRCYTRLGLWLYDHLDRRNPFPRSGSVSLQKQFPGLLKANQQAGLYFYDAQTDDVRLTLGNAKQAARQGAMLLNYTHIESAQYEDARWRIEAKNERQSYQITSRYLINAAGPWINEVNASLGIESPHSIRLIQGSHIIVKNRLPKAEGFILPTQDDRLVFVLPYEGDFMLIGTTEYETQSPSHTLDISPDEIRYLTDTYNSYFAKPISESDIIYSFSGIRPLIDSSETNNPSELSRDYELVDELNHHHLMMIYGGKITTHRQLAEECIDRLTAFDDRKTPCMTRARPLPPNNFGDMALIDYTSELEQHFPQLPNAQLSRLVSYYGDETKTLLETYLTKDAAPTLFANCIYDFEIEYMKKNEWLQTLDDFIWRRTKLGLVLSEPEKEKLIRFFQS